jgi:two-component system cell cycle sensor histidine kinase/response regulator CckA
LDKLVARGEHHAEASGKTQQVLSGQRVEAFETVRYRKDGMPLRVIAAGSPIMVDGVLMGGVAVYTDITDRVRADAALRESEEKFRTLVEESPLGIALIGKDGGYRYINPQFRAMFGYTLEDIPRGAIWFRKAFPEKTYRDKVVQTWIQDQKKTPVGQSRAREFTVTCKDGSRKKIHFRPVTLENMDQFVIYEDFTEKTTLERQFQQAQKFEAVGTLAGGIAHDFNNLLMGIHGRTSLMKMDLVPSHAHVEHLEAVEEYVRSAADLTKQLLGFARGGKYEVKPIDINELLIESATMFGRTKKEIRIHTKTQPRPLVTDVDRGQIDQVFLNLFVNAWQAMPDGGDLYLETKSVVLDDEDAVTHQVAPGPYVKVSIADTGIGMDDDTRLRIFDPFFTTKEKGRGTGLGLASAYGIINNHGGLITVNSEKGSGATFNIYLPLSHRQVVHETPMGGSLIKGSETVLLVDDEEMILSVGRAMLEKLGYHVFAANNGREAVELIAGMADQIDLVILDLIMPGMDGGKTFDRIREIRPRMRVLLSSGYAISDQANDILKRGCNGFIQKPFDIKQLSEKVRKLLDD